MLGSLYIIYLINISRYRSFEIVQTHFKISGATGISNKIYEKRIACDDHVTTIL